MQSRDKTVAIKFLFVFLLTLNIFSVPLLFILKLSGVPDISWFDVMSPAITQLLISTLVGFIVLSVGIRARIEQYSTKF